MRICILSPIYPTYSRPSLGIFVHEQAKYLAKSGNEVDVITTGDAKDNSHEIREGVNIYRIKSGIFAFSLAKKIIALNKKNNFDIVHSHFIGPSTIIIGAVSKMIKKPFVVTAHGIGLMSDNFFRRILNKIYLRFPEKIICVSNYVGGLALRFSNKDKVVVIKNGIDAEKLKISCGAYGLRKKLGIENEKILLSVSNLVERKGIDIIIKALPDVIRQNKNIKYLIIGTGPEEKNLKNLVKELRLEGYVVFIEYVTDDELANFYNACDVFILMSRTIKEKEGIEGFGIVYAEASYFGKPLIGGKSGGTADSIIDGITGYRIEPTDKKEIVKKVVLLLKDTALRKKLGANGKKYVMKELLWGHNVEKLVEVYKKLMM